MSRGLGQRQLAILHMLAHSADGHLMVFDLGTSDSWGSKIDLSTGSSTRRALYALEKRGLVEWHTAYLAQGRPVVWKITQAGRDAAPA